MRPIIATTTAFVEQICYCTMDGWQHPEENHHFLSQTLFVRMTPIMHSYMCVCVLV